MEVDQPVSQQSVGTASIIVSGQADPEAKVSINNQEIPVDSSGKFSQEIKLTAGVNNILVAATSKSGKVTKVERTVFLKK